MLVIIRIVSCVNNDTLAKDCFISFQTSGFTVCIIMLQVSVITSFVNPTFEYFTKAE